MRDEPNRTSPSLHSATADRPLPERGTMSLGATIAVGLGLGALIALVSQLF